MSCDGPWRTEFAACGMDDGPAAAGCPDASFLQENQELLHEVLANLTQLLSCPGPHDFRPTRCERDACGDYRCTRCGGRVGSASIRATLRRRYAGAIRRVRQPGP